MITGLYNREIQILTAYPGRYKMGAGDSPIQWGELIERASRGGPHVELIDYAVSPFVKMDSGVVVSGFWRSGTTWVQQMIAELIGAKSVFEPFDPRIPRYRGVALGERRHLWREESLYTHMPFGNGESFSNENLRSYMADALRARLHGMWIRRARKATTEAFRTKVVTKLVRGQLCLDAIQGTFGVPIIHIHRDPRAVVASAVRAGWGEGWLYDVDLCRNLLDRDDGRREYFGRWEDLIRSTVSFDAVGRIATFWALTERFILDAALPDLPGIMLVSYEDLSSRPHRFLSDLLDRVGVTVISTDEATAARMAERPSPTSGAKRARQTVATRMQSWKSELAKEDILTIEAIVERLGLSDRLGD